MSYRSEPSGAQVVAVAALVGVGTLQAALCRLAW